MRGVKLLLNSAFTGANAFFALADERGFFWDAGLYIDFTVGRGAYTAASRLTAEGFDMAYGDINALIELVASNPMGEWPISVAMVHRQTPSTIAVTCTGTVHQPTDLTAGRSSGMGATWLCGPSKPLHEVQASTPWPRGPRSTMRAWQIC